MRRSLPLVLVSDEDEETSLILISEPVVAETFKKKVEDEEGVKEIIGLTFNADAVF